VKQKFKDYRADFYTLSGKASDATRQLALAGIAIVWIFKVQDAQSVSVPRELLLPALFFVIGLALDLFQYAVAALIWESFIHYHSARGAKDEDEIDAHWKWNTPANFCFVMKIIGVVAGYLFLINHFMRIIKLST
jgi:hypothetical protein